MKESLKENIARIPLNPGIYLMKDENDIVIYVGKAISLKKRVRQYFQKTNKTERIKKMVTLIDHIDFVICSNEVEALMLECNYIKQYMPKFNVLLKDDKMYPYIKVTINEKYPSIFMTRQKRNDKAKYFGPYANAGAVKEVLFLVKQIFPIKRCKYDLKKKNSNFPCLYYHIGRCLGPCINEVNAENYNDMIKQICMFLEGKNQEIIKELEIQMEGHISKLEFEEAGKIKNRMDSIKSVLEKQKVANINENDTDVVRICICS